MFLAFLSGEFFRNLKMFYIKYYNLKISGTVPKHSCGSQLNALFLLH